jgi:hypothetical protein
MTIQPPATERPPMTLEQIAAAAAGLITEARDAGLTPPCALNAHDYGPPAAALYVAEHDTPDIWQALGQWAARYETQVTTRPSVTPGVVYAYAEFRHGRITYEVYSIIYPAAGDDAQPEAA